MVGEGQIVVMVAVGWKRLTGMWLRDAITAIAAIVTITTITITTITTIPQLLISNYNLQSLVVLGSNSLSPEEPLGREIHSRNSESLPT